MVQKYFLLFAIFFLTIVNVQAQEEKSKSENGLKAGSWSLQFSINNNFNLSSFEGALISAKKHFTDKKAIRFGVTLNGSTQNSNVETEIFQTDTLATRDERTDEFDGFNFGFNSHFLYYPAPAHAVNIYWGVGPNFQLTWSKTEASRTGSENQSQTDETKRKSILVGLSSILGVEWFATKNISFIAEYGLKAGYQYTKDEQTGGFSSRRVSIRSTKIFNIRRDAVKFGLSVYF